MAEKKAASTTKTTKESWRSNRTSAGVPRISKNLNVLNKKFVELIPDCLQLIQDVIQPKYEKDDNGKEHKVLPDKSQIDLARWVVDKQIMVEKEVISNKLRKLEVAIKEKVASDSGAISQDDPQQKAKEFGGPRKVDLSDFEDED